MSGEDVSYALAIGEDARRVLLAALGLYQRVAMGQWDEVGISSGLLDRDQDSLSSESARELMNVRCRHASGEALRDPAVYLSITSAHPDAQAAYDLWHLLGGGVRSSRAVRISTVEASIVPDPWQTAT